MNIKPFHPLVRTLMGPGPSNVDPRILSAMARPTIGHLDPAFLEMMDETKELLRYVFQSDYNLTMPVSAPGSAGMEMCFVNLIEPGDKVVVCQNGVFGGRMKENVERCGATAVMVEDEWGAAVDPRKRCWRIWAPISIAEWRLKQRRIFILQINRAENKGWVLSFLALFSIGKSEF